jgi:hypothetical protein
MLSHVHTGAGSLARWYRIHWGSHRGANPNILPLFSCRFISLIHFQMEGNVCLWGAMEA